MKTSFTPGPWESKPLKAANGDQCSGVWSPRTQKVVAWIDGRDYREIAANATLIAAAPDLLKALQQIDSNAAESVEWIRRVARAAIEKATAKAKGEA